MFLPTLNVYLSNETTIAHTVGDEFAWIVLEDSASSVRIDLNFGVTPESNSLELAADTAERFARELHVLAARARIKAEAARSQAARASETSAPDAAVSRQGDLDRTPASEDPIP